MARLLDQGVPPVQLNPQQLNLVFAQQATTQVSLDRKSEAFKSLVREVETSKQEAERYKERAKYLDLDIARTYGHVAKVRQQLTEERNKNEELSVKLANAQNRETICPKCHKDADDRGGANKIQGGDQTSSHPETIDKRREESPHRPDELPGRRPYQPKPGVSFEQHEVFVERMMVMKQELTRLANEKGQDVEKILDAAEYKKIIKKLKEDIQDKADENERLLDRIHNLCSEEETPASRVVQLHFMNERLQKRLGLSQVMVDTLSKHCEELTDELQKYGPLKRENGHAGHDSKVFIPIQKEVEKRSAASERTRSSSKGQDEVDGGGTLVHSEQQIQKLKKHIQQLEAQLKQQITNNQQAEKQREIFEQRYNTLMETMQDTQKKRLQCTKCHSLEQEIAKLKQEMADLKELNNVIETQMKLYEEDLRQEQQDADSQKQKSNYQIEQWKKNCQRMGQQVDLLTDDLYKEREENRRLKYQLKSQGGRSAMSLAPTFSNQRCAPKGPKSSPWQEGFHDIECDGPGQDQPDGKDMSDSMGEYYSTTSSATLSPETPGNTSSYHSMQSSFSLSKKPLECPRCKREYPSDRLEEFQRHVNKCIDSS